MTFKTRTKRYVWLASLVVSYSITLTDTMQHLLSCSVDHYGMYIVVGIPTETASKW